MKYEVREVFFSPLSSKEELLKGRRKFLFGKEAIMKRDLSSIRGGKEVYKDYKRVLDEISRIL